MVERKSKKNTTEKELYLKMSEMQVFFGRSFFWVTICLPSGLLVQFLETSDKITSHRAANTAIVHLNDVLLTCDWGGTYHIFNMFFGEISEISRSLLRNSTFRVEKGIIDTNLMRTQQNNFRNNSARRVKNTRLTKLILDDGNLFSMVDVQDVI